MPVVQSDSILLYLWMCSVPSLPPPFVPPCGQIKLTSRDPSPPPVEYVRGGGGIFKDMAVHDLDMSRFLMGSEPLVRTKTGRHSKIGD